MAKRYGVDLHITRELLQIGVMCAHQQRFEDAETIIRGVKAFRGDLPHPGTALATMFLFAGRLAEAAEELESVLAEFPHHQLGKALLGLVYRETRSGGWQRLLEEVMADGQDEAAVELARFCLGLEGESRSSTLLATSHHYA